MAQKRPASRSFYLVISILMVIMTVAGFWPTFFGPLVTGTLNIEPIFIVHGTVFMGWMIILVVQAALAYSKRLDLHRKVGRLGIAYGMVVLILGIWLTLDRFFVYLDAGKIRIAHRSMIFPFFDMLLFAGFFGAAVIYRSRPEIHKRLMLVASLVLLGPAVGRMTFLNSIPLIFLVLLSPILLGLLYDYISRRKVHAVYIIGLAAFLASGVRVPMRESEMVFNFSQWIFNFFL